MKLYGYTASNVEELVELAEVSFVANPIELRKLAEFFVSQAELFEAGDGREHTHFSDFIKNRDARSDVVVCNPKYG
ncbi:hypothetical protein [Dyella sp.]|uniref:hypothetical protein n=1 Tax=Dyella sp. TaxID=1869338 RepID=UPI002D7667A4|nr:hypothetical protein [Dyella sp.]HET7330109.1 hypothetical protein [Dyella sp.]